MEPLTQATLGAAAAIAFTRTVPVKHAFWIGALGGLLPDADVLIRSSTDPLLHLEYHRQFTHSIAFIPFGGAISAGIVHLLTRTQIRFFHLWVPATLGWATHGLLDACTSYGTQLLWPFSPNRIAWNTVSVIDPLFTTPLLLLTVLSLWKSNRILSSIALLWSVLYLMLGIHQRDKALDTYAEILDSRGHQASITVKPSFGNHILFRGFYKHDNQVYADSIRVPWIGEPKVYKGSSIESLEYKTLYDSVDSTHQRDLARFRLFSKGFLVMDPLHEGIIGDARYAMVPNAIAPMWGIDFGQRVPNTHMAFIRHTKLSQTDRSEFYRQLLGQ